MELANLKKGQLWVFHYVENGQQYQIKSLAVYIVEYTEILKNMKDLISSQIKRYL